MNQATNAAVMRSSNRRLILNMIRLAPVSRAELAQQTHLTRAAITQIVDELLEAQLVEPCPETPDEPSPAGGPGRKRVLLRLRKNARIAFGIYISRRRCTIGAVDLLGSVLCETETPVEGSSPDAIADTAAEIISGQLRQMNLPSEHVIGIGVSAPGPVDYREGVILNPPNFARWHGTNICAMLEERTGFPVLLEKDTNARALEEMYFGAAKDISNFMLMQVDDGVGSGIVIQNSLYRGARGMGTEIGHTSIRFDGPPCSCGGRGCLENYLRIPALLNESRFATWEQLANAQGEPDADRLLNSAAEYLSTALVNACNLYDLDRIILSGEVTSAPEPLLARVNPMIRSRALSVPEGAEPVVAGRLVSRVRTGAMAALYDYFQGRA